MPQLRYRNAIIDRADLAIFITVGETADTLAACARPRPRRTGHGGL
jgi:glucosamine 6-phosphate synthetase-like amidotransferase/phosphosugar isomerase protein